MEKRHINRNRRLAAAVAAIAISGLAYTKANAALTLELTLDGSGPGAGKSVSNPTNLAAITLDVWATVTGTLNSATVAQGLQSVDLNITSNGAPIKGNFALVGGPTGSPVSPWNAPGASSNPNSTHAGLIDLDGDGDTDVGSTVMSDAAGWWIARSGSVQATTSTTSASFLLGKLTFTPSVVNTGSTSLQVALRNQTNGALWFEDATSTAGSGGGTPPPVWSNDKNPSTGGAVTSLGAAVVLTQATVGPFTSQWTLDANGGNWNTSGNWSAGIPGTTTPGASGGDVATFSSAGDSGGARSLNLDANESIGGMVFSPAVGTGYTISTSSAKVITLNNGTPGNPTITNTSGNNTISAKVTLAQNSTVGGVGGSLTLTNLDNTAGKILSKTGATTLNIGGTQVHGVGSVLNVTAGIVNHNSNSGSSANFAVGDTFPDTGDEIPAVANLSVAVTGGVYNINANQDLKSLAVTTNRSPSNGGTGDGSIRVQIGNNSRVRVYDNGTNDDTDPTRATAEGLWRGAISGFYDDVNFNGGDGSGTVGGGEFGNGIFLNGVANTAINGLGMALVDDGNNFQNTLETREMELGDINGDNSVNGADGGTFATFFGNTPASFGYTTYTWMEGDFNGDGSVNGADGGIFAGNFGSTFNPANGPGLGGVSAVPEPASLGILAIGAVGLMRRRRKA